MAAGLTHFLFTFFSLLFIHTRSAQSASNERQILFNIKNDWGNPLSLSSWNLTGDHCSFEGIHCTGDGFVGGIDLYNCDISFPIPASICDLKGLTFLNLSDNNIPGGFPIVLYNCSKLQELDISKNYFVGELPADIDKMPSNLTHLVISGNNFTGDVPPAIGRLPVIKWLDLGYNLFNGTIPVEIGNLSTLETLILAYNPFLPAKIEPEFTNLTSLTYLGMSKMNLLGEIPKGFGRLVNLEHLDLAVNSLFGEIPVEMTNLSTLESLMLAYNPFSPAKIWPEFGNLTSLTYLWMSSMNLLGEVPKSFGKLANLEHLDLSMNSLVGEIPASVWMIKPLKYLYLFANKLTGEIGSTVDANGLVEIDLSTNQLTGLIPEAFGELKNLTILFLYRNNLSGEVPASIGRLSNLLDIRLFNNRLQGFLPPEMGKYSKLSNFEVDDNMFTGELPENLCFGKALTCLIVFDNQLTGKLPESLGGCGTLLNVQIQNNQFTGEFPAGIWSAVDLSLVITRQNNITGTLPDKFPWNLTWLEIQNNQFSGRLPSSSGSLLVFHGDSNMISGELPASFFEMSSLQELSLSRNQISGEIPAIVGSLKHLSALDLSNNHLFGQIPDTMGSMMLNTLDLSKNQLSGEIPSNLGSMKLSFLNLSFNDLTGEIPDAFQNQAFEQSFLANPNLCASNFISSIQICKHRSKKLFTGLLILFSILGLLIFAGMVLLCILIIKERRRREKAVAFPSDWKLNSFQAINFNVSSILNGLTDANHVGSGGSGEVYRVPLNLGDTVAVKRIHNSADIEKQFQAEVNILGPIRHDNIVKLLCCISGEDSKLLVYEYLQNGSLDRSLHRQKGGGAAPLEWPTRLQVAIDAAKGLCYLHHHCSPPVIHRDVKSSNILLDHKFNAKIADFGLAKALERGGELESVSAVALSLGYIAPEYSTSRKVNEKVDVYSFGVVLLELATGKDAIYAGEEAYKNLTDWAWSRYQDKEAVVDEEIVGESSEWLKEAEMMFKLGLMCTVDNPLERPTMKEVVQMLMSKRDGGGGRGTPTLENRSKMSSRRKQIADVMEDSDDGVSSKYVAYQSLE